MDNFLSQPQVVEFTEVSEARRTLVASCVGNEVKSQDRKYVLGPLQRRFLDACAGRRQQAKSIGNASHMGEIHREMNWLQGLFVRCGEEVARPCAV